MKILNLWRNWFASIVPCDADDDDDPNAPSGDDPAPTGDDPGEQEEAAARSPADELEEANRRIRELEELDEKRIAEAAEAIVMDLLPEVNPNAGGPGMHANPQGSMFQHEPLSPVSHEPSRSSRDDDEFGDDDSEDEQSQIARRLQALEHREMLHQQERYNRQVDEHFAGLREKFPLMDESRIRVFLATLPPEQRAAANTAKMAEITHKKQQRERDEAIEKALADRVKPTAAAPPVPSASASGDPVQGSRVSLSNMKNTLVDKLRAAGWGAQK